MDEKLWRKNGKEKFFGVCLVGKEERKINGEAQVLPLFLFSFFYSFFFKNNFLSLGVPFFIFFYSFFFLLIF